MSDSSPFSGRAKAIETRYSGYKFRSRLEARWAVFFDALEIEYAYEIEGYDLTGWDYPSLIGVDWEGEPKDLGWYLPDFWLPRMQMWLEIKGSTAHAIERAKCEALFRATGHAVLLASGQPFHGVLRLFCNDTNDSGGGEQWWDDCEWIDTPKYGCEAIEVEVYQHHRILLDGNWQRLQHVKHVYGSNLDLVADAAEKARSARFEHGESGG